VFCEFQNYFAKFSSFNSHASECRLATPMCTMGSSMYTSATPVDPNECIGVPVVHNGDTNKPPNHSLVIPTLVLQDGPEILACRSKATSVLSPMTEALVFCNTHKQIRTHIHPKPTSGIWVCVSVWLSVLLNILRKPTGTARPRGRLRRGLPTTACRPKLGWEGGVGGVGEVRGKGH
jgi:hypothetical protein